MQYTSIRLCIQKIITTTKYVYCINTNRLLLITYIDNNQ